MKHFVQFLLILSVIMFVACQTVPKTVTEQPEIVPEEETVDVISDEPETTEQAGAYSVSQELYDQTLAEVKIFIENLNKIIAAKDFNGWRSALTENRYSYISSAQFLREQSESPALKTRNIVLRTANDYFINVVAPARANSRADEIEFVDDDDVKVFFIDIRTRRNESGEMVQEARRLQLYELIRTAGVWKIKS